MVKMAFYITYMFGGHLAFWMQQHWLQQYWGVNIGEKFVPTSKKSGQVLSGVRSKTKVDREQLAERYDK